MIKESSIKDHEAFGLFRRGLQDLMLFFPLCGLSYMGEAVEIVEDASIRTLATDGRSVFYSPEWIKSIDHDSRVFDTLHEWLHIFFNHVLRRGDRDHKLWNIACDVVVVREACTILTRAGGKVWEPPKDGVIPPAWAKDMTAEQIYDELDKQHQSVPKNGHGQQHYPEDFLYDRAELNADIHVGKEEEFKRKFQEEMAQAVLIQQQINNKTIEEMFGPTIAKRLDEVLNGAVPWSRLLRGQLLADIGYEMPTYSPPNRRYFPEIPMPSMRSTKEERLMLLIDVSASVGETLMGTFKANVIPAAMRATETIIVTFDAVVREVVRTKHPRKALDQVKFLTGSHTHTSVRGAFELVDKFNPKALVCLTDGAISLPSKPYPKMIWVIPQNGVVLPWGRTFKMDVSW